MPIKLRNLISIAIVAALTGCAGASYEDGSTSSSGSGSTGGVVVDPTPDDPSDPGDVTDPGDVVEPDIPPIDVQAGTLTAGEYDDHLNLENYQRYLNDVLQADGQNLPYIDVASKLIFSVENANAEPLVGVKVAIEVEQAEVVSVVTAASGEAFFYSGLDGLPDRFDVVVSRDGQDLKTLTDVALTDVTANAGLDIVVEYAPAAVDQLDLMLVVDTTGSMKDELSFLKEELRVIVDTLVAKHTTLDVQVGLVVYRDSGEQYVSRVFDLTGDIAALQDDLKLQSASGGGDIPEAMQVGLSDGLAASWRANSTKVMLLVADAPPHDEDMADTWNSVLDAREQQIHILPLAASSSGPVTEFLMRAMAVATQSRYLFLTDDSGVGNPHDEPSVDCYVVTLLDNAIIRAIDSLFSGELIFPEAQDIVRKEGNYIDGVCEPETAAQ